MRLKDGFIVREIAGQTMALPMGGNFNEMIKLNDTAAFLWKKLELGTTKEALVQALLEEYDVDADTAAKSVDDFVAEMEKNDFLA